MKRYLLIGATIVVILGGLAYVLLPAPVAPPAINPIVLPIASSTPVSGGPGAADLPAAASTMISIASKGGALTVQDFIHNGDTIADTVNPGLYVLAGGLSYCLADGTCPRAGSVTDFTISYNAHTSFFTIVLLEEPLGRVRSEAEKFLSSRLGVANQQLCTLHYSIGAPYWVNSLYDSKNLGFSFCPGATPLPQ